MSQITIITNLERQSAMLEWALGTLAADFPVSVRGQVHLLYDSVSWSEQWESRIGSSAVVIISWMGAFEENKFLKQVWSRLKERNIPGMILDTEMDPAEAVIGVTESVRQTVRQYLMLGGHDNYRNLWCRLYDSHVAPCRWEAPKSLPWNGIYHPKASEAFTDAAEYRKRFCKDGVPTIGFLFYRDDWVWGDLAYHNSLIEAVEAKGMNAVAVFSQGMPDPALQSSGADTAVSAYFYESGKPSIDCLINTLKFALTPHQAVDSTFLMRLGVPVLQAYAMIRSTEDWAASLEGLTSMELAASVIMPEFDGVIHTLPVAGKSRLADGNTAYTAIPERIDAVVRSAGKWAALRHKKNSEKKIAIVLHNYPPDNSNVACASGLDTPESVRRLLERMMQEGYGVDHIPEDCQTLMDELLAKATNDRRFLTEEQIADAVGWVSAVDCRNWARQQSPVVQAQLERDWGPAPGAAFNYNDALMVPGMLNGNVLLTVQPPRGFGEDAAKLYHSPDSSPTWHYMAVYHWIRDLWQADAVIHMGTHGSLEWLPGKATALSMECYSDLAIGDMPNIYPYWISVVGEGIQAKRRGSACLVSYLSPPMSHAGTYDELEALEQVLDEYCHFRQSGGGNLAPLQELVREKAAAANMDDVAENTDEDFDLYVQHLHTAVTDVKNLQIRVGLHVLGQPPQGDTLTEYMLALTRVENGQAPSLTKTVAECFGYDYYELLEHSGRMLPDGSKTYGALADDVREYCRGLVERLAENDFDTTGIEAALEQDWCGSLAGALQEKLVAASRYVCTVLASSLAKTTQEIESILEAMEGRYVEPGPGGAPTSGCADILPTGRNFYGVDPRNLPTPAAWKIGVAMGDDLMARYVAEEGRVPESVGITFWGTSNMRSHGQCIAQFLYLLGVRPLWQRGSQRVNGFELIPMEELGRPRLDVTARISGFFRDSMPSAISLMDSVVEMVANLDESPDVNYIRKHALEEAEQLKAQGLEEGLAWEQACYRIFGDPPGTYGAGVSEVLQEKNWETIDELAKVFVRWGGHVYSKNKKGAYMPELFSKRLEQLDITVQNLDNREISMLNSEDFNAYHGGMIAAVRSLKGEAPRSYCGDSSDRQQVMMRSVQEETTRMFRGETMNPKYIEGMKQHGYKGAADLASHVSHCYEWDATSNVMDNWMYEGLAQKYALDPDTQQWMQEVNPWALQRITEKLLEADQRGLWDAKEETREALQELYLSIEGELEGR